MDEPHRCIHCGQVIMRGKKVNSFLRSAGVLPYECWNWRKDAPGCEAGAKWYAANMLATVGGWMIHDKRWAAVQEQRLAMARAQAKR